MAGVGGAGGRLLSRRQVLRGATGLGLAAATGTLFSACGSDDEERATGSAPEAEGPPETTAIRLFSLPPAACYSAMYAAEPFLREEGFTDVTFPQYTIANLIENTTNGAIDFGIGYAAVLMPFIEKGAPVVFLGGIHVGCWQIFVRPTGDIQSLQDFRGKTVSVVSPTFVDGLFIAMTLGSAGLDIRKDVKLVNYPPTENARLLESGEVDAVVAFPPASTDIRARGVGRVVLDSMTDPPWSGYYCCYAFANRDWLERNPIAAKRALRAVLRGTDAVATDPDGTARFMVDRGYTPNYDYACEALREIPYDVWRDFDSADSIRFYALRLKEAGMITSAPDEIVERATDFRYFNQLQKELKGI